ncbi:serine carboxypeptidase S28-domain-containing protein [Abortiporus biennis]|nr:serine carboxypeptidase S28-domain-containing protein [Abortiporus biennis]
MNFSLYFTFLLLALVANGLVSRDFYIPSSHLPPIAPFPRSLLSDSSNTRNSTAKTPALLPPFPTSHVFNQLIDHNNPQLGTFSQRYWYSNQYYQPGGPIVLFTPGESPADGYVSYLYNTTLPGAIASQTHGLNIVLEHRFFGNSNPYPDLTVQSLKVLTVAQAIEDLEYFAQNVVIPVSGGDQLGPDKVPWILTGSSYSGALVSWTMVSKPGVFFAGFASSAVVQAITDYWQYFDVIRQVMPQNCSSDVQAVIQHIDTVFNSSDTVAIQNITTLFGLQNLTHFDDFAAALRNNLWDYEDLDIDTGPGGAFYDFCDALEVNGGVAAGPQGWGVDNALQAWGSYWINGYYAQTCGVYDPESCLGSYDPTTPYYTATNINNPGRSWKWLQCNEMGSFQTAAPPGYPSLVSRLLQPSYEERTCMLMFPEAFSNPPTPAADSINQQYQGWNVSVDKLFFSTGNRDEWKEMTISASGANRVGTDMQPIVLNNGFHCSDMLMSNAIDDSIGKVQQAVLSTMTKWLGEWRANGTQTSNSTS